MTCRKTTPLTMNLTSNLNINCSTFGSQTLILLLNSFTLQRATATNCKPNESLHEDQPTWRGVADLPVQVQELFRCIKFSDPWHPFPSSDAGLDFHNNSRKCSMKVKFVFPFNRRQCPESTISAIIVLLVNANKWVWHTGILTLTPLPEAIGNGPVKQLQFASSYANINRDLVDRLV